MIPAHTKYALDRYVHNRFPPGGFLISVLSNDLVGAVGKADDWNRSALADIVIYLYNNVPATCWGSPEAVQRWLEDETTDNV